MLLYTATLKDGRVVLIREFRMEDTEKLFQIYESLSAEAVRWGMPPYTRDRIEKWWLSNLQNLIPIVALHGDRIVEHAQIFTPAHTRRKGTADLAMYLHQDFHNVGLGAAMLPKPLELARREGCTG